MRDRIKEPLFRNTKILPPVCGWPCLCPLLKDLTMVLGFSPLPFPVLPKFKKKNGNEIIRPPPTTKQHRQGRAACRLMPPPALIQLLIEHAATAKYRACVFIIILKAIALDLKNKWLGFSLFPAVFWQCLLHSRLGGGALK